MAAPESARPVPAEMDQRQALAEMIERHAGEIEARWLELVQQEIMKKRASVQPSELRDAMGDYLLRLAESLKRESTSDESRGAAVWGDVAREHAITRVRLGFDVAQLVHEFVLLRRVLVEFARMDELIPEGLQADSLTELIEAAISVAVHSYVESRDYEFRKLEAEHIGFLTHELRNPLATVSMAAAELCRRLNAPASSDESRLCQLMTAGHARLKSLIDTVLLTEKLQTFAVEVRPVELTLGQLLNEALQNATEVARNKGLKLQVVADANIALRVDRNLTISVIQNLVDNAVKYTDRGKVELRVDDLPDDVVIHVLDECPGIPPDELSTIFEPFKRGRSSKPGTGLGLAIAKKSVELQDGEIHGESLGDVGRGLGCHFWFKLPKRAEKA
ncbi:MAG: sensor histidine kinase [Deltaproteobacteria bacterium]|nr:sensor histidine kinase [Deltaproteobacteria bacterium]